jgi:hypothetical protein
MTVAVETEGRGTLTIKVTGVASVANGGVGAVLNPEGVDVIILRTTFYAVTPSTGAANLSADVASAANGAATDILNACDVVATTAKTMWNGHAMQNTAKTQITAPALWQAGYYITFTGSASCVGLVGYLFVEYVRAV